MWPPSQLTTINVLINILGNFITSDYRSHIEIHENVRVVENRLANAKSYEFSTYAVEAVKALAHNRFPENFLFGAASGRNEGDYDFQGQQLPNLFVLGSNHAGRSVSTRQRRRRRLLQSPLQRHAVERNRASRDVARLRRRAARAATDRRLDQSEDDRALREFCARRVHRVRRPRKIGMSLKVRWFEPHDPASYKDIEAAEMSYIFANYWFVNPLLGERGNYHEVMQFKVGMRSAMRGLKRSRLPEFTGEEVRMIRGSLDFLGIDYFQTHEARYSSSKESSDSGATWSARRKEDIVADAKNFEKSLVRLNADYILPRLIVTATGYGDSGGINDLDRAVYYYENLSKLLTCLKSGIDVRGYLAWSLTDSSFARMNSYRYIM
ncbi:unnamed protein product [Trichogramma brassicae]|uniref:Uncharacterized protein n=1 Tax=Trichogramma brassicae TaxID=86971 RepID=A0A6H5I7R8_9HYME|nr:unnamed protein product [Trichogramma brassicae]